ncbi:MAG: hypothetical protein F4Z72_11280 [Gemmatimonadales bacterium]|nr:hypothetical protein [Candidatus Palauibacter irciniicola]
MSLWKRLVKEPKGALPGGMVTKAGVVLIAVLVAGLLFSSSLAGPGEDATAAGAPVQPRAVNDREGRSFDAGIRDETQRETQRAAADSRDDPADSAAGAPSGAGSAGANDGAGGRAPGMGRAEFELREALRLEEVERRTRSLRSFPVAQSHRDPNGSTDAAASPVAPESPDAALDGALASLGQSLVALEAEMAAGLAAGEFAPGAGGPAPRTEVPAAPRTSEPGRLVRPHDPPGWERIHEGTFLEAVLVTQLSGEFPGPVLALVSAPLYSADRQRVLIPRGARVVGTARAVQNRDQSRLAVAFHRLLLPDGSWVDLEFTGLNQVGESALRDQVNRRYRSTFAAAGAVGALSGLTLAGASPYGLRAGVGQGLGGSATSMLDRYLNRLPEITIRAGHRLRIWFTSDVLVPTPPTHR